MLIAALFTIAKTWKQSKGPSTDEWIKKVLHMVTSGGILLSHQREWNNAICGNMGGPRADHIGLAKSPFEFSYKFQMNFLVNPILSEVRQRKTNIIWYH